MRVHEITETTIETTGTTEIVISTTTTGMIIKTIIAVIQTMIMATVTNNRRHAMDAVV